jgi:hypothetical protein
LPPKKQTKHPLRRDLIDTGFGIHFPIRKLPNSFGLETGLEWHPPEKKEVAEFKI